MGINDDITKHYQQPDLLIAIEAALAAIGKTPSSVTVADLASVDEFHVGGRAATKRLFDQLDFAAAAHLIDVGCGIGGPARLAAQQVDRVTGFDLTPAYVDAGNAINGWLGLDRSIELRAGDASGLDVDDDSFDGGYMLHVGMNIADKAAVLRELARVLRPGARFGIYDIMQLSDGSLSYPLPWASDPATSHVAPPAVYRAAATEAGFEVEVETSRRDEAMQFFQHAAAQGPPPPLSLKLLMGSTVGTKLQNMVAGIKAGFVAPVELILRRKSD